MPSNDRALTERELEVAEHLSLGHSYQAIAHHLVVSVNTVKTHVQNIYLKAGVGNKTALARWYRDEHHPNR